MIRAIIFSKDRPAQLDLFLQSYYKDGNGLFSEVHVLYCASTTEFANGYARLQRNSPYWISFKNEKDFAADTLHLIKGDRLTNHNRDEVEYICFFTDDNIIYRPISKDAEWFDGFFRRNPDLTCFSFRLGNNTYIQDQYASPPQRTQFPKDYSLEEGCLLWDWRKVPPYTNFAYPLSVDGHIFRREVVQEVVEQTITNDKIVNPNALEGTWQKYSGMIQPKMACFPHSVVINSPNNRVQDVCCNTAGEIYGETAEEMNAKFLEGRQIQLESIDFSAIIGCHQELEMKWN